MLFIYTRIEQGISFILELLLLSRVLSALCCSSISYNWCFSLFCSLLMFRRRKKNGCKSESQSYKILSNTLHNEIIFMLDNLRYCHKSCHDVWSWLMVRPYLFYLKIVITISHSNILTRKKPDFGKVLDNLDVLFIRQSLKQNFVELRFSPWVNANKIRLVASLFKNCLQSQLLIFLLIK